MKKFFFILFVLIWNTAGAFQSVVILPFSNRSDKEEIYWLGEGFAESLSEELQLHNAVILPRRVRLSAYEDLHLPYTGELSRATMLKIAAKLSADYVVFGSFNLKDSNLEVEVRVIKSSASGLSAPIQAAGSLDRLYQVQLALRDGLLRYFNIQSLQPETQQVPPDRTVPLHAYELYIKGLMENSDAERIKFLQKAMEANPGYSQAAYRLGFTLFRLQRYRESSEVLKKASFDGMNLERANFLTALNAYYSGDFQGAYQMWLELSKTHSTAEVYSNIGLALMKQNDMQGAGWNLAKAVELNPGQADYHFNLAASYVLRGYDRQAVQQYREVINRRPADYQALYLIAKLLERESDATLKDLVSKRVFQCFQETVPSDQKGKFPEQFSTVGQLLRPANQFLTQEESDYQNLSDLKNLKDRANIVKSYQTRSAALVDKLDSSSAILEIKKGVSLSPFDSYLHYQWGRSLSQQKNQAAAVTEFEFSIWCEDNVDSRLALADLYRESERYSESKAHVQRALALDPQNKKALEIWGKIWDKQ